MPRVMNGQLFIAPAVVSRVDDSALSGPSLAGAGLMAIIGEARGGPPMQALRFTSASAAARVLLSGNGLDAVRRAFLPGPDVAGAPVVYFVRVNQATQAVLNLLNSTDVALALTSLDYGVATNQVRVKVEDGTDSIGKKLSLQFNENLNIGAQVARKAIAIKFLDGSSLYSAVNVAIAGTTLTATATLTAGGTTTTTVDLTLYSTLQGVVDQINAWGGNWSASITGPDAANPSLYLDEIAATSVRVTSGATAPIEFWANHRAVLDWFNNYSGYVSAVIGAKRKAPSNIGWTYLGTTQTLDQGTEYGRDNTTAIRSGLLVSDWSAAMDALMLTDISIVCVATPDATVHGLLKAHVDQASSQSGRMERVMIVGGDNAESIAAVKTRASAIRDPRAMLVYPGITDYDQLNPTSGNPAAIAPWLLAPQLAGMFCGQHPAEALTHRFIQAVSVERRLTPNDIDDLLLYGICPMELVVNRGIRVVQSKSTYTADNNYRRVEISVMRASDELVKRIRAACDQQLIGRIVSPSLLSAAANLTQQVLFAARQDGIIVGDPGFRNIVATASGDYLTIDFDAVIAIPANYINITAHLFPFVGSLSL